MKKIFFFSITLASSYLPSSKLQQKPEYITTSVVSEKITTLGEIQAAATDRMPRKT